MTNDFSAGNITGCLFGALLFVIGFLNMILVHPVPGVAYFLLSLLYFPPVTALLKVKFNFSIPPVMKIILGITVIMFTLGVSDLGDMIDKW